MARELSSGRRTSFVIGTGSALMMVAAACTPLRAQEFGFVPSIVAGAPGTTSAPFVDIVFDAERSDANGIITMHEEPGRLSWVLAESIFEQGFFTYCSAVNGRLLVAVSGTSPIPGAGRRVRVCRARAEISVDAELGTFQLPGVSPTTDCTDATGAPEPCTYVPGNLLVGPRAGTATITYVPPAGTSIELGLEPTSIDVVYSPGSAGDGVDVTSCIISGADVVRPLTPMPQHFAFAGPTSLVGSIGLACRGGLEAGTATLACSEQLNAQPSVTRSWTLTCPETRIAPTVTYEIAPGAPVIASGAYWSGDFATTRFRVSIERNGLGVGAGATSSISNCDANNGFRAQLMDFPIIAAEGTVGAMGTLSLYCTAAPFDQLGTMSCEERRGAALTVRTWPVQCPARPIPVIFNSGFEAKTIP